MGKFSRTAKGHQDDKKVLGYIIWSTLFARPTSSYSAMSSNTVEVQVCRDSRCADMFACSDCLAVLEKSGPGPRSICDPKPEFQERQATILAVPLSPILSFPTRQRTPPTSFLTVRAGGMSGAFARPIASVL